MANPERSIRMTIYLPLADDWGQREAQIVTAAFFRSLLEEFPGAGSVTVCDIVDSELVELMLEKATAAQHDPDNTEWILADNGSDEVLMSHNMGDVIQGYLDEEESGA